MVASANVFWIGGPSGSGKSTLARLLCRRFGLRWYSGDTRTWDHRDRAIQVGDPDASRFEELSVEQRDALPPEERYALQLVPQRRRMVLDDLAALPASPMVVADSGLLEPGMTKPAQAVWLTASPMQLVARITGRGWGDRSVERARANHERQSSAASGVVTVLTVDGHDPGEVLDQAARLFAERIAHGPVARDMAERRQLVREGNLWITHQYRSGLTRYGRESQLPNVVRAFDCECADTSCQEFLQLPIAQAPSDPNDPVLLAPGHEEDRQGDDGHAGTVSTRR